MRGRKPQSSATRRLTGNAGKRAYNQDEPRPPAPDDTFDVPPAEVLDHPRAVAEWQRLAPMLRRARQVTEADRGALLALCLEWARYLDATAMVQRLGLVVKSPNGFPMTNPYLSIATRALVACNKLWPELGLTPSSRSRVKAAPAPASADPFAEFDEPPTGPLPKPN